MMYYECELSRFDGVETAWVSKRHAKPSSCVQTPDGRLHYVTAVSDAKLPCRKMHGRVIAERVVSRRVRIKL